jgi:hypothetical protein
LTGVASGSAINVRRNRAALTAFIDGSTQEEVRARDKKNRAATRSAFQGADDWRLDLKIVKAPATPKRARLDLGGRVGGDFHADANFDDHRGGPSHCFSSV